MLRRILRRSEKLPPMETLWDFRLSDGGGFL